MSALIVLTVGLVATIFAFVTGTNFLEERLGPESLHKQTPAPVVTTAPTPTPTPIPTVRRVPTPSPGKVVKGTSTTSTSAVGTLITCTGPDGKKFTTTEEECREFNEAWGKPTVPAFTLTPGSDPVITCNVHTSCGGGSRQMKRSECDQTTCCRIGDKWYFYLSKDKCKKDQEDYWANYYKSIPTPKPWPTLEPSDDNWAAEFLEKAQKEANQMTEDYKKELQEIIEFEPTDYPTQADWSEWAEDLKKSFQPAPTSAPRYWLYP